MSDTKFMDIEPGGESTQYESIKIYTNPPAKQTGQMGGNQMHTKSEMRTMTPDSASKKAWDEDAEMARQVGLGGSNSISSGANDTNLTSEAQDDDAARNRRLQGYGPGSGVGA